MVVMALTTHRISLQVSAFAHTLAQKQYFQLKKLKIVFLCLRITKITLEKQAKHTQCCNAWLGPAEYLKIHFSGMWNTLYTFIWILWIQHAHSCRICFSGTKNLLVFCCKIQYFTVARHLTFSALSSCPFTCIHPFFLKFSYDYKFISL